jgi:DMSO/TMAO reductase YedYZ molybdopterin-dependent catalytic subunit
MRGFLKPMPMARYLMQRSAAPQYTVNLPIEVAMGDNFLLATLYNGQADSGGSRLSGGAR